MNQLQKYGLLCDAMEGRYPVLASVWRAAHGRFGGGWLEEFIRNIECIYGEIERGVDDRLATALDGYAGFANDSMRNQVYYEKHGRYRASSYEQARRDYYLNEEHMTRCYLPGMYLSHLLWPRHNHITLIMAIEEAFGIRFTTREVMGFHNVGEMLTCLERKLPT